MTNGSAQLLLATLAEKGWAEDHRTSNLATAMICQIEDSLEEAQAIQREFNLASIRPRTEENLSKVYEIDDKMRGWNKQESKFREGKNGDAFSDKEFQVCVSAISHATKQKQFVGGAFHLELRELFKLTE